MNDLVFRDDVINILCSTCKATDPNDPYECTKDDDEYGCPQYEAIMKLRSINTHNNISTWEQVNPKIPDLYMCSNCRQVEYPVSNINLYKFCPFCGKAMRIKYD